MKKTLTNFLVTQLVVIGAFFFSSDAHAKPYTKVFKASYDSVWKATLIALSKYPLEKNDKSSGEISTTMIEGDQVFKPYNRTLRSNEQYKLTVSLEKRKIKGLKIVVLRIEKMPMIKGDFMNVDREVESDGIEENILLYRVSREVIIDRAVEKLFK